MSLHPMYRGRVKPSFECIKRRRSASDRVLSNRSCRTRRSCSLLANVRCNSATRCLRLAIIVVLSDSDVLRACTCMHTSTHAVHQTALAGKQEQGNRRRQTSPPAFITPHAAGHQPTASPECRHR